jgi:hypothetical protein
MSGAANIAAELLPLFFTCPIRSAHLLCKGLVTAGPLTRERTFICMNAQMILQSA